VWVSDCERQGIEPTGQLPHTCDNICLYYIAKRCLLDESKALDEQELHNNDVFVLLNGDEAAVELQVSLIQRTLHFPERILEEIPYRCKSFTFRDLYNLVEARRSPKMLHISVTAGTIVSSQFGGDANKMETYVEQLNVGGSASEEERHLKETLIELRQAIEMSPELGTFAKKISDSRC
jgi:hypothetical protein